ncbi:hypothetical protein TPA0905_17580 [Streptomyces olivaceus]|nr:hypothetical protein TPA0905_17580 [Streptomyces olivaceus]
MPLYARPYVRVLSVRPFVQSYECFAPPDTGKSTKRPTVSNDTGTPEGPLGTGARPEGSVCVEPDRERDLRVKRSQVVPTGSPVPPVPLVRPFLTAKGKTLT